MSRKTMILDLIAGAESIDDHFTSHRLPTRISSSGVELSFASNTLLESSVQRLEGSRSISHCIAYGLPCSNISLAPKAR